MTQNVIGISRAKIRLSFNTVHSSFKYSFTIYQSHENVSILNVCFTCLYIFKEVIFVS